MFALIGHWMQGEGAVPKGLVQKVLMLVFTLHHGLLKKQIFENLFLLIL